MDLTLDIFEKIGGHHLTLLTRCLTLRKMVKKIIVWKGSTGDCGEDSESWSYHSVPE
jgi:hypothetical protein